MKANPIRIALIGTTLAFATAGTANAAGCLKGAVVGGVAGHHVVVGAVGGCMVGRYLAKQHAQHQAALRFRASVL